MTCLYLNRLTLVRHKAVGGNSQSTYMDSIYMSYAVRGPLLLEKYLLTCLRYRHFEILKWWLNGIQIYAGSTSFIGGMLVGL